MRLTPRTGRMIRSITPWPWPGSRSLTCPTERPPGAIWFFGAGVPSRPNEGGLSSYAGCQNDIEAPIDVDNHGVFYLNSRVRVIDVSDGLAQTLFVGEVVKSSPLGWVSGTRATLRNTGSPLNGLDRKLVEEALAGPPPLPADLTALEFERMIAVGRAQDRAELRRRLRQPASRRGQLRLRRRLGAFSHADDRPDRVTNGWATAPMASPSMTKPIERA